TLRSPLEVAPGSAERATRSCSTPPGAGAPGATSPSRGARCAGLGCAGLGCAGLGCAGLGCAGLGCAGLGCAGLGCVALESAEGWTGAGGAAVRPDPGASATGRGAVPFAPRGTPEVGAGA